MWKKKHIKKRDDDLIDPVYCPTIYIPAVFIIIFSLLFMKIISIGWIRFKRVKIRSKKKNKEEK